ncbi:MAG: hypothetical protein FWB79_06040 [Treponema sp.]|nr:hypothetical protein [Treponema sp.]MCL2191529.1 hypothetical protein [Treponema sp.]
MRDSCCHIINGTIPDFSPKYAFIDWDIDDEARTSYLPRMKTDIILQSDTRRLVIETKYYGKTMRTNYDRQMFISGHLYQIYAYVKNIDKKTTGNVAGVLLYAKTDETITPDDDLNIGGNRISLKTLDLNREWKGIKGQLDSLCEWLNLAKGT